MCKIMYVLILNLFLTSALRAEDNLLKTGCELLSNICFVKQDIDSNPPKFLSESENFQMNSLRRDWDNYNSYSVVMNTDAAGRYVYSNVTVVPSKNPEQQGSLSEVTFANSVRSSSGFPITVDYLNIKKDENGALSGYVKITGRVDNAITVEIINRNVCDLTKSVVDDLAKAKKCLQDFNEPYAKLISQINKEKDQSSDTIDKFVKDRNMQLHERGIPKTSPFDLNSKKIELVDAVKLGKIMSKCSDFFKVDYYTYKKEEPTVKSLSPSTKKAKAITK